MEPLEYYCPYCNIYYKKEEVVHFPDGAMCRICGSFWYVPQSTKKEDIMIKLGDNVKDTITGYTGVVVARTEWLYGCVRFGVQSKELKDGKPMDVYWLDEAQTVKLLPDEALKVTSIGGPAREGGSVREG